MNPFDSYLVIAPIAASFAGFGSLASGLGHHHHGGDDARVDATRLTLMLFASLSAALLGLLPMTIAGFVEQDLAVRLSSLAGLIAIPAYATVGLKRARSLRRAPGFNAAGVLCNLAFAAIAFVAFTMCAAAFPPGRLTATYLVGLMGMLGSSAIMFSLVIVSMLRRHEQ